MTQLEPYTPVKLAAEVAEIVAEAQARITGVGAEQYHIEGQRQKFETMPLEQLVEYFEEELLDQINYAVMNLIRVRRLKLLSGLLKHTAMLATADAMVELLEGHKPK